MPGARWDEEKKREALAEIDKYLGLGWKLKRAAAAAGVSDGTARNWLGTRGMREFKSRGFYEMADRLKLEVPEDTRSLTHFLLGDPLPGRSALDARQGLAKHA